MDKQQTNTESPPPERRCCFNCQFFCSRESDGTKYAVTKGEREVYSILQASPQVNDEFSSGSLCCYKNVWDSKDFEDSERRSFSSYLSKNRGNTCFFYPYIEDMLLPAADELERREADRREAEKDRKINRLEAKLNRKLTRENADSARRTAWAAIIVAIFSVVVTFINIFWPSV